MLLLAMLCLSQTAFAAISYTYFYDNLDRLTKASDSTGVLIEYVYDEVGNQLEVKRSMLGGLGILDFSPSAGDSGEAVTIQGQGFDATPANNTVTFNGTPATVVTASATSLGVTVPAGATTGSIAVTVGGNTVTAASNFTILQRPRIDSISPGFFLQGAATATLMVTGQNLTGSAFVFTPTFVPPLISIDSSSIAPDGLSATFDVTIDASANSQVLVASSVTGTSTSIGNAGNTLFIFTDPAGDPDGDGLSNSQEIALGTNPFNTDTDSDGLLDAFEVNNGLDPLVAGDELLDSDNDGLDNLTEQTLGTEPLIQDTDKGGRIDGVEVNQDGTDPLNSADDILIDGDLLVLDGGSDQILRINTNGSVSIPVPQQAILAATGEGDAVLFASGVVVDGSHTIYFAERISASILKRSSDGTVTVLTSNAQIMAANGGENANPAGMTLSRDGFLYATYSSSNSSGAVLQIDPLTGSVRVYVSSVELITLLGGRPRMRGGIVADSQGTVYVASTNSLNSVDAIVAIAPGGTPSILVSNGVITSASGFLAVTANDDVLLADSGSSIVHRITSSGSISTFISSADLSSPLGGAFANLQGGITFDEQGAFYIAESDQGTVLRFDAGIPPGAVFVSGADIQTVTGVQPDLRSGIVFVTTIDSDGDGLNDSEEQLAGTDANNPDSDGDGLLDGFEVENGFDPITTGEEGLDSDNDGLTNLEEQTAGTDPGNPDYDSDGLSDGDEVNLHGTDPRYVDTDEGGRTDGDEVLFDGTNPLDPLDDLPSLTLPRDLFDGNGFRWDVQQSGRIQNGSTGAYDGGLTLFVDNASFSNFGEAVAENNQRELMIGSDGLSGLQVLRKVFVPDNDAFIRYLEILDNPGAVAINATVRLSTNLESNSSTSLIATSSGDDIFTAEDDYLITTGTSGPSMMHVFSGPGAALEPAAASLLVDFISYEYAVTVPAGGRVILMHFASQNIDNAVAQTSADTLHALSGAALDGMSVSELHDVVNFSAAPDADADGLPDSAEQGFGTDPANPDSDGDGLLDGFEVTNGFDPLAPGEELLDGDSDGLDNLGEQAAGADPAVADTDGDGLNDGEEINTHSTSPLRADTDDGGRTDLFEVILDGTDPNDSSDDFLNSDDLYLLEPRSRNVLRISPTGQARIAISLEDVQAATGFSSVSYFSRGIVADAVNNTIYFTDGGNDALLKRASDGQISILASSAAMLAATGGASVGPAGLAMGSDGFLYVNETSSESVLKVDPNTGAVSVLVTNSAFLALPGISSLTFAGGIVGDDLANIFVLSSGFPDAVFSVLPNGTPSVLTSGSPINNPEYLARGPGGDIFISEFNTVHRLTPAGGISVFLSKEQLEAFTGSNIRIDHGIAFDSEGHFYIGERNQDEILRFEQGTLNASVFASKQALQLAVSGFVSIGAGLVAVPIRDQDGDGLSDENEFFAGTDPANPDSDSDGMQDGFEVDHNFDPLNPADATLDADSDGLTNFEEHNLGTDPRNQDTDGDGLIDGDEVNLHSTNPLAVDSDGDGLSDGDEINIYATDPLLTDTDADGLLDSVEVQLGSDPLNAAGTPAVGLYGVARKSFGVENSPGPGTLYLIDPVTGTATEIGPVGFNGISAMDMDSTGTIYATGRQFSGGSRVLLRIDPETGLGTQLGFMNTGTVLGMSFRNADDTLFAYSGSDLVTIDVNSAQVNIVGPVASGSTGHGIAFAANDSLFHATEGPFDTLNQTTGTASLIGNLTFLPPADANPRINALDNDPITGSLYGSLDDGHSEIPENYLTTIDTATAAVSIIGPTVDELDALAWGLLPNDSDGDGLVDPAEALQGTNPAIADTDGDGLLDGFEVRHGFNPLLGGEQFLDPDADTLDNMAEQTARTDPNNADTDGDSLSDADEVNVFGTDPRSPDTDGGGETDGVEIILDNTNPLDPNDDGEGGGDE